jgi:hypothetical protein
MLIHRSSSRVLVIIINDEEKEEKNGTRKEGIYIYIVRTQLAWICRSSGSIGFFSFVQWRSRKRKKERKSGVNLVVLQLDGGERSIE